MAFAFKRLIMLRPLNAALAYTTRRAEKPVALFVPITSANSPVARAPRAPFRVFSLVVLLSTTCTTFGAVVAPAFFGIQVRVKPVDDRFETCPYAKAR